MMEIKPVDYDNVFGRRGPRRAGSLQKLLDEFVESGLRCVEVENYTHKSARVAYMCLRTAAIRYGMPHIHVHQIGDKVYLVNSFVKE